MEDIARKIQEYIKELEARQKRRAKKQGRLDAELDRLVQLGFSSVEEAKAFLEKEDKNIEKKRAEIVADMEEFENVYSQFLG